MEKIMKSSVTRLTGAFTIFFVLVFSLSASGVPGNLFLCSIEKNTKNAAAMIYNPGPDILCIKKEDEGHVMPSRVRLHSDSTLNHSSNYGLPDHLTADTVDMEVMSSMCFDDFPEFGRKSDNLHRELQVILNEIETLQRLDFFQKIWRPGSFFNEVENLYFERQRIESEIHAVKFDCLSKHPYISLK